MTAHLRIMFLLSLMVLLPTQVSSTLANEPAITLSLNPMIADEPLTTHATIKIPPNYLNYEVCVEWDGLPQAGRGCWSLSGQYERRTQDYDIKHLPAGEYTVTARLYQVHATHSTPAQTIRSLETPFH